MKKVSFELVLDHFGDSLVKGEKSWTYPRIIFSNHIPNIYPLVIYKTHEQLFSIGTSILYSLRF